MIWLLCNIVVCNWHLRVPCTVVDKTLLYISTPSYCSSYFAYNMLLHNGNKLDVMRQCIPLEQACLSRPAVWLVVWNIKISVKHLQRGCTYLASDPPTISCCLTIHSILDYLASDPPTISCCLTIHPTLDYRLWTSTLLRTITDVHGWLIKISCN